MRAIARYGVRSIPGDEKEIAAAFRRGEAVEGPAIKSVDGLIGALRTGGFVVDIDHRDNKGDYYLVVTAPKDHALGYLLTVDDKNGSILEKKKIDPTAYGYYAETPDYGKPKEYSQPDDHSGNDSGGDNSYGGGSSGGGGSGY